MCSARTRETSGQVGQARVVTLNGLFTGHIVALTRPIVSIGNSGTQMAVVTRRDQGWFLTHLEGLTCPLVNGESIGLCVWQLADGDLIEMAGTILRFEIDDAG